jgi:hypothetical protein
MRSSMMKLVHRVPSIRKRKMCTEFWTGTIKRLDCVGEGGVGVRILLKLIGCWRNGMWDHSVAWPDAGWCLMIGLCECASVLQAASWPPRYMLTLWSRSSSKYHLIIQSIPQREQNILPLQRSTGFILFKEVTVFVLTYLTPGVEMCNFGSGGRGWGEAAGSAREPHGAGAWLRCASCSLWNSPVFCLH